MFFGVLITFVFTMYFLYRLFIKINAEIHSKRQICILLCFITTLFMGMGEAALYVGAAGLYAVSSALLYLTRIKPN